MKVNFQFHDTGRAFVVKQDTLDAAKKEEADGGGDPDGVIAHLVFEVERENALDAMLAVHELELAKDDSTLEELAGAIFRAGVEYGRKDKFRWQPES